LRVITLLVFATSLYAAEAQLSSGASLPAGMTAEQAKELARQNGLTNAGTTQGKATGTATSIPRKSTGERDTLEGLLTPEQRGDSTKPPRSPFPPKPDTVFRWGQSIFRAGSPDVAASYAGAVGPDYALGPGDEVILTLWGEKEARYELELDRDGQVAIELVGVVSLNGQNLRSAEALLRKRLTKVYSGLSGGTTQMDVTLGKLKRIRVYVMGDVEKPGSFILSGNTTVLAALFQAHGPNDLGSERQIEVHRGSHMFKVDIYDYLARGRRSSNDILQDGDLVRIPRKGKVIAIRGEIGRPGLYELLPSEGGKELLQYAGGVNAVTAKANLTVQRFFDNGRRDAVLLPTPAEILSGAPTPLEDGDSIWVFPGTDPSNATVHIRGDVRFPGSYPVEPGLTVGSLVAKAGGLKRDAYAWRALITRQNEDGTSQILRHDLTQGEGPAIQSRDSIEIANWFEMATLDSVAISGAVRMPGRYPWRTGMTVKDLILQAGGFLKRAEFGTLRLETPKNDAEETLVEILSLDSSLTATAADHLIEAAAHLAVPFDPQFNELEYVEVKGWVVRPGRYSLSRPDERLSEIIERAGGLKREGYLEGARLLRGEADGARIQVHFKDAIANPGGKSDLAMRDGDTLFVPKIPATVEVKGRVNSPGHIVWQEGRSWNWYIEQSGGLADSAYSDGIYVQYADGSVQTKGGGITSKPNPGAIVNVPFRRPPEPITFKDTLSGVNAVLATVIAGLTIMVLLQN